MRCVLLLSLLLTASANSDDVSFVRDVRPILSDRCFHCHGPDAATREADLRLDNEASAKADRDGQFVINTEHPEDSELLNHFVV
ncbi:MAG: c-type cytochrome domain-containing protein [Planctomycetaceae bacterium]